MIASRGPSTRLSTGFTLVEMVMVIIILGILAAVGAPMIANGLKVATLSNAEQATLNQLRYATERVARELREVQSTGGSYSFSSMNAASTTFTKSDGTVVAISYSNPNLSLGYGGSSANLATQVSTFTLAYLDINGGTTSDVSVVRFVDVEITVRQSPASTAYTQRVRVALRNSA
jgi:prepilin-type N-terminal cleavage/methylation domain-containing protein